MATKRVIFECPICSQAVTRSLEPLPESVSICHVDGQAAIPEGYFGLSDPDWWTGSTGGMLVNLADLVQVSHHPDLRRNSGCCGRDGCDGPNLICQKGHEIGTERSDCWMSHAAILVWNITQRNHQDPSKDLQ